MQEIIKDSTTITLFGKKIPFDLEVAWTMSDDDEEDIIRETEDDETEQKHQGRRSTEEDFESSDPSSVSSESGNPKTPSIDEETVKTKDSDKTTMTVKKPDKIVACPRCKSMDTKFCYYNNYNVSQPRHFCKSCQRYWTSGGTMRNVPVGAGRRKSKSSAATAGYPQICISDSQLHHQYPTSRNHATVLSFSSDTKTQGTLAAMNRNVDDSSSDSTVTTTTMSGNRNEELLSHHHLINGYGGVPVAPPWPYNMGGVPFYPFWTCHVPNPWNLPWPPPYPYSEKRFREGDDYWEEEQERPKKVHAPKTLRMDDPNEAAKSSIWATLGIKNDGVVPKGGFFKKTLAAGEEDQGENNPSILCANPAAFSRSLNFHETH